MATDNGPGGPRSLLSLRTLVRQESDIEGDLHIADAELTNYINQSRYRLYDKLITAFGEDYYSATAQFTTDGAATDYALPDGVLYSAAPAFYKGLLVEAVGGGNVSANAPVTLLPFNLREKNRYQRPLSILAVPNMFPRYRLVGSNITLTPLPASGLVVKLWYAPRLSPLVGDSDVADDFSGWLEWVIVDAAIKVMGKQERDASLFAARLAKLDQDIDIAKANRNLGDPNTVVMTEGENSGPFGMPGFGGGLGGSWW